METWILKTQKGGDRSSNFELLRLLSMLMVLNLHSFWGFSQGSGVLQSLDFFREATSICAVNVFLLISGFFGIRWKIKSFFNLVFQLFFYAFAVYSVAVYLGLFEFSLKELLYCFTCLYTFWGFITKYLLLYLCSPLLNSFDKYATNRQLIGLIVIFIFFENFITRDYSFLNYCTMYLIGRYLNRSNLLNDLRIKPGILYWVSTLFIFILVFISFKYLHICDAKTMQSIPWGLDYAAPLVILQAVAIFILFARWKFHSRFVNWCATSCLSIFLIHAHPSIIESYYKYTESLYEYSPIEHILKLMLLFIITFVCSILFDKIRIVVSSVIYKGFKWFLSIIGFNRLLIFIPNQNNNG